MTDKQYLNKLRILKHLEDAISRSIDSGLIDALETAKYEIENRYPQFNSRSTILVTCPVCGKSREVIVKNLYSSSMHTSRCERCAFIQDNLPKGHTSEAHLTERQHLASSNNIKKAQEHSWDDYDNHCIAVLPNILKANLASPRNKSNKLT